MDAQPFIDRVLDDESLTADLTDDVAKKLIEAVVARMTRDVTSLKDRSQADTLVTKLRQRTKLIATVIAQLCDTKDPARAQEALNALGYKKSTKEIGTDKPLAVLELLLAWEAKANA